jgi:hypothetical protein
VFEGNPAGSDNALAAATERLLAKVSGPVESGLCSHGGGPSWVHVKEALGSAFFSFSHTGSLVVDDEAHDELDALYAEHIQTFITISDAQAAEAGA